MKRALIFVAFALCAALAGSAHADTEDPLGKDEGLDRVMTVHSEGIPLSDLLAKLSARTGLALRADRSIEDEKVILLGPPRPLRAILTDIAVLTNDTWRHYINVEGKRQFLLFRDPKAKRYEEGLAASVTRRMMAQLEEQVAALDEPDAQFAKRPETDRIKQNFAKPILHGRSATRLFSLLDEQQKETLFARGYVNISFAGSRTTDQQTVQAAFREAVSGLEQENARVQQEHPEVQILIDAPENLRKYGVRFNLHHENNDGLSALVVQVIMGKGSYMTMGEFDSGSQWMLPPHGDPYTLKGVDAKAELPSEADAQEAARQKSWLAQLWHLAETSKMPVVADFYRCPPLVKPLPSDRKPQVKGAVGALDSLCEPAGYLWWTHEKTLLFRKRDWYQQRLYEVPDRWIAAQAKRLKDQKLRPTYGNLAALLELTPPQVAGLNNLLVGDGGTPDDADTLAGVPELLQLTGAATMPDTPLYSGSLEPDVIRTIGIPGPAAGPGLPPLIAAFLASRRQLAEPSDVANFRVCFTWFGATAGGAEPAAGAPRFLTVVVEWNPGGRQTPFDQRLQLYLPIALPDDRMAATRIEYAQ